MSPDLIIVDTQDQQIGAKSRDTLTYDDIYRVSALWVTNSNGDVLLAQRTWGKRHDPGKWGPAAAGTVEVGETYESNVYKEAEEEIGLTGYTFAEGPKRFYEDVYRFWTQWYTVIVDKDVKEFVKQDEEVEALAWFPADKLKRELKDQPQKFVPGAAYWPDQFL
jgi:isopentenyl-diphosphate Delta-isomerase